MTVFEQGARLPQKHPVGFTAGALAVLLVLTLGIYSRTWSYGYLDWDDNTLVEQNLFVMQPTKERVRALFVPGWSPGAHLPLRALSYVFDREVLAKGLSHAEKAKAHHRVNTWLYLLNGVLLFFLFRKLLNPWAGAVGAAIWLAHPIHVEAVSWVSGRKEMLSGAFILGSVLAYIAGTERLARAGDVRRTMDGDAGDPGDFGALLPNRVEAVSFALAVAGFAIAKGWGTLLTWLPGWPLVPGIASTVLFVAAGAVLAFHPRSGGDTESGGVGGARRAAVWLALAVLCTLGGLLSKPVAVVIPPILLAWELGHRPRRESAGWLPGLPELKGIGLRILPHALLVLWSVTITVQRAASNQVVKDNATWNAAPKSPLVASLTAFWLDFYHLIAPLNLSSLYDVKSDKWYLAAYAGIAVLCAVPLLAAWLLRKSPKSLIWLAWWIAPLIPVSGIVPLASPHADRYLYLPCIALAVALAVLLTTAAFGTDEETGVWERYLAAGLTVAIVGGFATLSVQRARVWEKDHLLWGDAVKKNPDLPSARNNYGAALMNVGKAQEALKQYYEAYRLLPSLDVAQFNIAATEMRLGNIDKAQPYAEQFVAQHPEMPTGFILLGQIYQSQAKSLERSGGSAAEAAEKFAKAEASYRHGCEEIGIDGNAVLQLQDQATICGYLGQLRASLSNTTGALLAFNKGLEGAPANKNLLLGRAKLFRTQKRFVEAKQDLDLAYKRYPADVDVLRAQAHFHQDQGDLPQALEFARVLLTKPRATPNDLQLKKEIEAALKDSSTATR